MSTMTEMVEAMPSGKQDSGMDLATMTACIEACGTAAMTGTMCADADAAEGAEMARCAALCAGMADVATATMRITMRPAGYDKNVVMSVMSTCVQIGEACAAECRAHADTSEHCRICAGACEAMVMACTEMLTTMEASA